MYICTHPLVGSSHFGTASRQNPSPCTIHMSETCLDIFVNIPAYIITSHLASLRVRWTCSQFLSLVFANIRAGENFVFFNER